MTKIVLVCSLILSSVALADAQVSNTFRVTRKSLTPASTKAEAIYEAALDCEERANLGWNALFAEFVGLDKFVFSGSGDQISLQVDCLYRTKK
jgi:hypothetical protein